MPDVADCAAWQDSWPRLWFWNVACMGPVSSFEFRGHCVEAAPSPLDPPLLSLILPGYCRLGKPTWVVVWIR